MKRIILLLIGLGLLSGYPAIAEVDGLSNGGGRCSARIKDVDGMYSLDNEGRLTISRIIGTFDLSAKESYDKVKEFIEGNHADFKYEILFEDTVGHNFTAEGYYDAFYQRKPEAVSGLGCHVDSRLRMEAKDGRIRVTVTVLNYRNDAINVDPRTIWPFNSKDKKNRNITGIYYVSEPTTVPKSHASRYFNAAVIEANSLLTDIEKELGQKRTDSDW